MDVLATAEQLKNELDALRPLNPEAEARIMQKFRLDWNYHSNNLEGNSLTYGETKALILFGITAQGKPLKDHFEITGHNEALNWIVEIVKDKTELTEVFIRQLHQLLLKESYEVEAQTQNGKRAKKRIEVGKYKTQPNHVITQTGETFYFATPEETPAKMQEIIEWFRNEKEKPDINPIILAALFHYKFIRIHPFDDGNGRVARILMNFILMQYGFPPVIIKTSDKENYFSVLQQADAGIFEPFIEYIAENLVRSLEIMIKGAKGEDIEEPEDLDKELALLEGKLKNKSKKLEKIRDEESLLKLVKNSIRPLAEEFVEVCRKFDKFYVKNVFSYRIRYDCRYINATDLAFKDLEHYIKEIYRVKSECLSVKFEYSHSFFNTADYKNFSYSSSIFIIFGKTEYKVKSDYNLHNSRSDKIIVYAKLYDENLSHEETQKIVKFKAKQHKDFIEKKLQQ